MPPCPHTSTTLPTINTPTRAGYVCYSQSTWTDHHSHLKPTVCVRVHSRCCIGSQRVRRTRPSDSHSLTRSRFYNLWVWTHTMACVHHCSIAQNSFTISESSLPSAYSFLFLPATPGNPFTVSIVMPFPECHIVGTILCNLFRLASFT